MSGMNGVHFPNGPPPFPNGFSVSILEREYVRTFPERG